MKIFLCLLLIKVCSCLGDSNLSNNYFRRIGYDDEHYGHQQHGPIERPCSLHDVNCIRRYFVHNSQCSAVHGPAPDLQRIKVIPMFVPHVNITFTLNYVEVKGLNDFRIKEFYINKETQRLVLEVEFRKLWVLSLFSVITFHRKGQEPLELADYAVIEYKDLSFTLTAPYVKNINLSEAHVFTYISDANPRQELGPNFTESKEPQVRLVLRRLSDKLGLSVQEVFVTKGPILMSAFLRNSICSY